MATRIFGCSRFASGPHGWGWRRSPGALRAGPARQPDHLTGLGRRGRLVPELAQDPHRARHKLLVRRELALRVVVVVLEADADVPAQQDRLGRRGQLRAADGADAEDRLRWQHADHHLEDWPAPIGWSGEDVSGAWLRVAAPRPLDRGETAAWPAPA